MSSVPLRSSLLFLPLLIIMAAAFAVIIPFFFLGNPSGHDFEFHMNSWMEVLGQWKQGILYPRWASLANHGYGEARFIFYPPASWMIGAALGGLLPWRMVPGAYVWLALTLSGCSMFLLARGWMNRRDAIFAAAVYAANPYYLVIVYWRSAFAELLAGALFPLLLLAIVRLEERQRRGTVFVGVLVAAAWLTNIPAAVMLSYSLALLVATLAIARRRPGLLLRGAVSVAIGAALAAFFLLPAMWEQKWVALAQVLAPGVRPQDNFLFTIIPDPDHNRFNLLVSLIAATEIIVVAIAARARVSQPAGRLLVVWSATGVLLMSSLSGRLWAFLPALRFAQIPWRWLLCLSVSFAVLVTLAARSWATRAFVYLAVLIVMAFVWQRVQPPWWDNAASIAQMAGLHASGGGYEGADEYVPAGGDAYDVRADEARVTVDGGTPAAINVTQWDAESKQFVVNVSTSSQAVLRLFYYPAWRVRVNGQPVEAEPQDDTGAMIVPLPAGNDRVQVYFARTWDRIAGNALSLATILAISSAMLFQPRLFETQPE